VPNNYPLEVRERATRMGLDRLPDYPSPWDKCRDLGEKLNVDGEVSDNHQQRHRDDLPRSASRT
jgi:hypothetical protein